MKPAIRNLLFDKILVHNGNINYENISKIILKNYPSSGWKPAHGVWYTTQIVSPDGKYFSLFPDTVRTNLAKSKRVYTHANGIKTQMASTGVFKFPNQSKDAERNIALALGKVCQHIHPEIVSRIIAENKKFKAEFQRHFGAVNADIFLYDGSDCVFPGFRRPVSNDMGGYIKYNFNWNDNSIVNDPAFPKHIWTFLTMNKPYDEKMWKNSGLADFGLAHIFGYQAEEKYLEQKVFQTDDAGKQPESYFTSASNTVLIPNGLLALMNTFETVKIAFYKRHIDLYGNHSAMASGLDERYIPDWYEDIKWNPPLLPDNWQHKTDNLLAYRRRVLI